MEAMTTQQQYKNICFTQLSNIEIAVGNIAAEWETKTIPLTSMEYIMNKAKIDYKKINKRGLPLASRDKLKQLYKDWNITMGHLYDAMVIKANEMQLEKITVIYVYALVDHVKQNWGSASQALPTS